MMKYFLTLCLALVLLVAPAAFAHSAQQGDIQIGHIWARANAVGATVASVYVPLLNKGEADDALVAVSTPVAESAMLHESTNVDGVSHMTMLDQLPLPSKKPIAMRPGGRHIMLMGLKQQLKEGETFPLTLQFAHAGDVTVTVTIQAAGAQSGDH